MSCLAVYLISVTGLTVQNKPLSNQLHCTSALLPPPPPTHPHSTLLGSMETASLCPAFIFPRSPSLHRTTTTPATIDPVTLRYPSRASEGPAKPVGGVWRVWDQDFLKGYVGTQQREMTCDGILDIRRIGNKEKWSISGVI